MSELIEAIKNPQKTEIEIIRLIPTTDLSYLDENSDTPLIVSCKFSRYEVMEALINTGESNPGHANNDGKTALIALFLSDPPNERYRDVLIPNAVTKLLENSEEFDLDHADNDGNRNS